MLATARLAQAGLPVHLLMIGGQLGASDPTNAAYLQLVQALIAEQGITDRVRWTGFTEEAEVSANLLAADMAVLPYRDGVSFRRGSLMAAIAHELPVISTEPAVRIPQIIHGENMWLEPVSAPAALASAISRLWNDPILRQRLSAGSALLARQFAWDTIAQQHVRVYLELIERTTN
jgi:glycosyltransferase involved in cell wall biosynthesis